VANAEPFGESTFRLPLLTALTSAGIKEGIYLPSEELVEDELDGLGNRQGSNPRRYTSTSGGFRIT
jgi:hypothetical protein